MVSVRSSSLAALDVSPPGARRVSRSTCGDWRRPVITSPSRRRFEWAMMQVPRAARGGNRTPISASSSSAGLEVVGLEQMDLTASGERV